MIRHRNPYPAVGYAPPGQRPWLVQHHDRPVLVYRLSHPDAEPVPVAEVDAVPQRATPRPPVSYALDAALALYDPMARRTIFDGVRVSVLERLGPRRIAVCYLVAPRDVPLVDEPSCPRVRSLREPELKRPDGLAPDLQEALAAAVPLFSHGNVLGVTVFNAADAYVFVR